MLILGRTSGSEDNASPVREIEVDADENPSLQILGRSRLGIRIFVRQQATTAGHITGYSCLKILCTEEIKVSKNQAAVSCSANGAMSGGVGFGLW